MDKIWVDLDLLDLTLNQLKAHSLAEELFVCPLHVGWHMRANIWNIGVERETANEALGKVEQTLDLADDAFAEAEEADAVIGNISLSVGGGHVENDRVLTLEGEDLKVLDLSVGIQDGLVALELFLIFRGGLDLKLSWGGLCECKFDCIEAFAFKSGKIVCLGDLSGEDWEELTGSRLVCTWHSGITSVDRRGIIHILASFELMGIGHRLDVMLLLCVIKMDGKKRSLDCLDSLSVLQKSLFDEVSEGVLVEGRSHVS